MMSHAPISLLFILLCCCQVLLAAMADIAQSLLEKLQYLPSAGTGKRIKENFSLGMEDWDSDDNNFELLARTKWKCNGESPKWFADPTTSEALEETSKGVVPKNTQKNDQWALRALTEWITERNKCPMGHLAHRRCRKPCKVAILIHYRTQEKGRQ